MRTRSTPGILICIGITCSIGCGREAQSVTGPAKVDVAAVEVDDPSKSSVENPDDFRFRERRLDDVVYRNGQEANRATILESLGGGVAIFDYDGDQLYDLCFPGGGKFLEHDRLAGLPTMLLRNRADLNWEQVAAPAGLDGQALYSHGAHAADYDNDGFTDLLITGYGSVQLWQNLGDGTFRETAVQAGVEDDLWSSSAAWADFNADGFLDLYVAHYVNWSFQNDPFCPGPSAGEREICSPRDFEPLPDAIYLNQGDGTFRVPGQHGLRPDGKGLGVIVFDADTDGDADIYVANDTTDNFLYLNDGQAVFNEAGLRSGVAVDDRGLANGSMGVALLDYNLDGRSDLCVANYERESFALYRNEGQAQFLHLSRGAGLAALGGLFVGFGTVAADLDLDGDEDLAVANGHVVKFPHAAPRRQMPLLLANREGHFERLQFSEGSYFSLAHEGRGLAMGDLDNDGDTDLVASHLNEPAWLLENAPGETREWFGVRLIGRASNRDAVGARLDLHTADGLQRRQIVGGGSYLSSSDLRCRFGLTSPLERLEIRWPSGLVQEILQPRSNQLLTVVEPG